jgi:hypothetical protein
VSLTQEDPGDVKILGNEYLGVEISRRYVSVSLLSRSENFENAFT